MPTKMQTRQTFSMPGELVESVRAYARFRRITATGWVTRVVHNALVAEGWHIMPREAYLDLLAERHARREAARKAEYDKYFGQGSGVKVL